jgi:hypothetical protein
MGSPLNSNVPEGRSVRWYSGASEEQSCYTYMKTVTQQEKKNEIFLFPYPIPP